ncbi:MAG: hypothetical protein L0177_09065, partial [Chloroflexi bacterium]|nr:hypothetical protein [Chloroflexota bacterium]
AQVFFILPGTIYLGNLIEFVAPAGTVARLLSIPALVLMLLLVLGGRISGAGAHTRYVTALAALALLVWLQSSVLVWDYGPLDMLVPDQLIDRTKTRASTFFEDGIVGHIGFADPFCPALSEVALKAVREQGVTAHEGGAYLVIEGPQFSTRAESQLYRSWGASVIGMTALPEAKLAREAELCYATIALVTDYDVWHDTEASVSVELVIKNLMQNVEASRKITGRIASMIPDKRDCGCGSALQNAIITAPDRITPEARKRLSLLVDKYLK